MRRGDEALHGRLQPGEGRGCLFGLREHPHVMLLGHETSRNALLLRRCRLQPSNAGAERCRLRALRSSSIDGATHVGGVPLARSYFPCQVRLPQSASLLRLAPIQSSRFRVFY
jgi:hypothetical protein